MSSKHKSSGNKARKKRNLLPESFHKHFSTSGPSHYKPPLRKIPDKDLAKAYMEGLIKDLSIYEQTKVYFSHPPVNILTQIQRKLNKLEELTETNPQEITKFIEYYNLKLKQIGYYEELDKQEKFYAGLGLKKDPDTNHFPSPDTIKFQKRIGNRTERDY